MLDAPAIMLGAPSNTLSLDGLGSARLVQPIMPPLHNIEEMKRILTRQQTIVMKETERILN